MYDVEFETGPSTGKQKNIFAGLLIIFNKAQVR